eukprot:scaffold15092_cov58-Phaeocystis_antarctica.AAC.2
MARLARSGVRALCGIPVHSSVPAADRVVRSCERRQRWVADLRDRRTASERTAGGGEAEDVAEDVGSREERRETGGIAAHHRVASAVVAPNLEGVKQGIISVRKGANERRTRHNKRTRTHASANTHTRRVIPWYPIPHTCQSRGPRRSRPSPIIAKEAAITAVIAPEAVVVVAPEAAPGAA